MIAKQATIRVEIVVVDVACNESSSGRPGPQRDVDGSNLSLTDFHEKDRRRVYHTLEHGDAHDYDKDSEDTNLESSWLLTRFRAYVLNDGRARGTGFLVAF